jgi:hypothetical protein
MPPSCPAATTGTEIKVPTIAGAAKLSIGRWFKRVGDPVTIGEPLEWRRIAGLAELVLKVTLK